MGQMGFFDIAKRYAGLDAKNAPLVKIDEVEFIEKSILLTDRLPHHRQTPDSKNSKTRESHMPSPNN